MCITVAEAKLSKTKILTMPLDNGNHYMAYSNSFVNEKQNGKNAMILPIKGKTKQEWFYDTTNYKSFLDDIVNSSTDDKYMGYASRGISKGLNIEIFNVGMYNVGLTDSIDSAAIFLSDNNVEVKEELINFFREKYVDFSFAVCIFDSTEKIDSQPIAFEYIPNDNTVLFYPTMDCHTGDAPDLREFVETDHHIIYVHDFNESEFKFAKTSITLNNVPDYLNNKKYRFLKLNQSLKNGDIYINIDSINKASFLEKPHYNRY